MVKMWSGLLLKRGSGRLGVRSALAAARSSPNLRASSREASVASYLPFGWIKKAKTQQVIAQNAGQEDDVIAAQNRVKKFERQEEKFIPVTRRTLVKKLVEEEGLLSWEEKRLVEPFAASLDTYYSQKFYALLEEAKVRDRAMWGIRG